MNESAVVFIVNVQAAKQGDGKYTPRVNVIRKNRRSYSPYLVEVEPEEFFTALAAVEHGRQTVYEILRKRVPEAEVQFVDMKGEEQE